MKQILSVHAVQRLNERNIELRWVEETINQPDSCKLEDGFMVYQKLWHEEKSFLLRVYVNEQKTPPLIVTVYKTTKIEKYL